MSFYELYDFLRDLQKNNSKEWMDENRKRYHQVRDWYIEWLNEMDMKLGKVDENYYPTSGKKAINRINNNLMFHPEKPVYKDHFGAGLDKAPNTGDFYIHLGTSESFIAGGFYRPSSKLLSSIREAIDYNGDDFKKIINKKSFKNMFGGLMQDDMLKMAPKGFSQTHKHIELLRHKSFAVSCAVTQKEVQNNNFQDGVVEIYKEMLPFRRYLNKAVTV
ncbi:hypothetical protein HME9304_00153 [Flagellimonas maritima]|uniref:DUF2461 domain-containing protein n=1 Tax=Flagellimonas maritima TaxID=1383885 RepID=A0A2Z4LN32_9FLAO|nr:DUF2461 domain-containing protein [Allomuricauda aurantiaca]AWX43166.1 hypothetical protein HME9304_00153 [Allomuricauda aurantiaca]